ncbi:hypothetical protein [Micromonospora zhanjiangensis]|uniref:Uncharacterized protein n=1 Tax=Micromonospora zhanjiangensis TaxID=1522057 RepID=A0ABV8KVV9_9ACTN
MLASSDRAAAEVLNGARKPVILAGQPYKAAIVATVVRDKFNELR